MAKGGRNDRVASKNVHYQSNDTGKDDLEVWHVYNVEEAQSMIKVCVIFSLPDFQSKRIIHLRVTFCKTDTPEIHDPPPPRFP